MGEKGKRAAIGASHRMGGGGGGLPARGVARWPPGPEGGWSGGGHPGGERRGAAKLDGAFGEETTDGKRRGPTGTRWGGGRGGADDGGAAMAGSAGVGGAMQGDVGSAPM
ncbi:hypothetical protein ZWY2020_025475 [Hordeum vulgare]|nr:hypothetical protein ZWY2020_025475 [Hordeum vulgare]